MTSERDKLKIYVERAKKDLIEETRRNDILKRQLAEGNDDDDVDSSNDGLKGKIDKMRKEMERINSYTIDMASNPA